MAFAIASSLTVALAELLSQCLLLPPMLCGYQILWICCIIVPILTLPIAMAKEVTNVMNQLPRTLFFITQRGFIADRLLR